MNNSSPPLDKALEEMLRILDSYLPSQVEPLPEPSVSAVRIREQAVGLGNRRGTEARGEISVVELKGVRLDALVRFQLWGESPDQVETAMTALNLSLMSRRDQLRVNGFLRLMLVEMSLVAHLPAINTWRKQAEYQVLYEYHYEDTDGAESLIARIPVEIDGEFGESTVVTDEMTRWDDEAAPLLDLHGGAHHPFRVGIVSILAFLPEGWDGSGVTVSASVGDVFTENVFASIRAFLDTFTLEPEPVELGENPYIAGNLFFPNADFSDPIILKRGTDFFRIRYDDLEFDTNAVVYLRVLKG